VEGGQNVSREEGEEGEEGEGGTKNYSYDQLINGHDWRSLLRSTGAAYAGTLSRGQLLRAMGTADALVNSSISEGMCNSILEAMRVGCPVIVRGNKGNRSIVSHCQTGMLFDTPEAFVESAKALLFGGSGKDAAEATVPAVAEEAKEAGALKRKLVTNALEFVEARHSLGSETRAYGELLARATAE
jgi:glycosyltransferase involved in cell wall biosynthesis